MIDHDPGDEDRTGAVADQIEPGDMVEYDYARCVDLGEYEIVTRRGEVLAVSKECWCHPDFIGGPGCNDLGGLHVRVRHDTWLVLSTPNVYRVRRLAPPGEQK